MIFDYSVPSQKIYLYKCSTRQQVDRCDLNEYLYELLIDDVEHALSYVYSASENIKYYKKYCNDYYGLVNYYANTVPDNLNLDKEEYKLLESKIVEEKMLHPPINIRYIIRAEYTSPQGRSYHKKDMVLNYEQLQVYISEMHKHEKEKQNFVDTRAQERAKMTPSLRYDVLKRDGYKCQICGATASDGVKLHVDHIIPIAKGGKTEMSNLQTLCDMCNFGKRDKM